MPRRPTTAPQQTAPDFGLSDETFRLRGKFLQRKTWDQHPNMQGARGLARFWLFMHDKIKALGAIVDSASQMPVKRSESYHRKAQALNEALETYYRELNHHEFYETKHHFHLMLRAEPEASAALEGLRKDHALVDQKEKSLVKTWRAITARPLKSYKQRVQLLSEFSKSAGEFVAMLNQHFKSEEDIVIPIILKHDIGFDFK